MKEKLPKPMLDALARAAKPTDHPSADLLTAFAEQALSEGENLLVSDHLARCGECREAVFLASAANQEMEQEVAAAAAATPTPRSKWVPRLLWAAPVAAAFLIAAGYFTTLSHAPKETAPQVASNLGLEAERQASQPLRNIAPSQPTPEVVSPVSVVKASPKSAPPKVSPVQQDSVGTGKGIVLSAAPSASAGGSATLAKTGTDVPKAKPEPASIAIGGAVPTPPLARRSNAFAPSGGEGLRQYSQSDALKFSMNSASVDATRTLHPGWRVTAQGVLEHFTPEGWTRVLADQANSFRAVAVVGAEVWAAGNGGMLVHSNDSGLNWKKVSLVGDSGAETAAIVSLHFDDPQHGVAVTDSGASYVTSDGGATWTRQ